MFFPSLDTARTLSAETFLGGWQTYRAVDSIKLSIWFQIIAQFVDIAEHVLHTTVYCYTHTHTHTYINHVFVGLGSLRPVVCHCDHGGRDRPGALCPCMFVRENERYRPYLVCLCVCVHVCVCCPVSVREHTPIQTSHSVTQLLIIVEVERPAFLKSHFFM